MINVTFETHPQALHVIIAGARAVGCDAAEQVADLIFPVGNWIAPRPPSLGTSTGEILSRALYIEFNL